MTIGNDLQHSNQKRNPPDWSNDANPGRARLLQHPNPNLTFESRSQLYDSHPRKCLQTTRSFISDQ